jgi:hypothetical protein
MTKNEIQQCILILEPEILILVLAQYLGEGGYTVVEGVQAADFYTSLRAAESFTLSSRM